MSIEGAMQHSRPTLSELRSEPIDEMDAIIGMETVRRQSVYSYQHNPRPKHTQ
jgi:hypothetical protein